MTTTSAVTAHPAPRCAPAGIHADPAPASTFHPSSVMSAIAGATHTYQAGTGAHPKTPVEPNARCTTMMVATDASGMPSRRPHSEATAPTPNGTTSTTPKISAHARSGHSTWLLNGAGQLCTMNNQSVVICADRYHHTAGAMRSAETTAARLPRVSPARGSRIVHTAHSAASAIPSGRTMISDETTIALCTSFPRRYHSSASANSIANSGSGVVSADSRNTQG